MRALITGGAGFIGAHLARRLLADGMKVDLLDDFSRGPRDEDLSALIEQSDVSCIKRDLSQTGALDDLGLSYINGQGNFMMIRLPMSDSLAYRKLMNHWYEHLDLPLLNIRYENLVENFEENCRALIDFCGLPWDEQCLRFYDTSDYTHTASYEQVRKPLYKGSIGRWKHYEKHLAPLVRMFADLEP